MNNNLNNTNNYINQNNSVNSNANMGINNGYMNGATVNNGYVNGATINNNGYVNGTAFNNGNYMNVNNTQNNVIDEQKKKNDRFLVVSIVNGLIGLPMATTFFGLFFLFGAFGDTVTYVVVMITVGAYILISFFCFIIALVRSIVQLFEKK